MTLYLYLVALAAGCGDAMRPSSPGIDWLHRFDLSLWRHCAITGLSSGELRVAGTTESVAGSKAITRWLWGLGLSPAAACEYLIEKSAVLRRVHDGGVGAWPDSDEQTATISSFASHLARMEGTGLLIGAIEEARISHTAGNGGGE